MPHYLKTSSEIQDEADREIERERKNAEFENICREKTCKVCKFKHCSTRRVSTIFSTFLYRHILVNSYLICIDLIREKNLKFAVLDMIILMRKYTIQHVHHGRRTLKEH